jgi:hypothetical protein
MGHIPKVTSDEGGYHSHEELQLNKIFAGRKDLTNSPKTLGWPMYVCAYGSSASLPKNLLNVMPLFPGNDYDYK